MDHPSPDPIVERLRRAREALGFTQSVVAEQLGLPRTAVTQLEAGQRRVSGYELERLARLYGRKVEEFFLEDFAPEAEVGVLFRSQLHAEPAPALLEAVGRFRELDQRLSDLEDALGIEGGDGELQLPGGVRAAENTMHAVRQGQRAAVEERRRRGLGDQPLPDLAELFESWGVRTFFADLPEGVDGFTLQDPMVRPFLVVTKHAIPSRTRFNLAHEYGHVVMDRSVRGNLTCQQNRAESPEVRANAFAAAFLMPEEGVAQFLAGLGKRKRQTTATILEGSGTRTVRNTQSGETSALQAIHVVQVALHFGASRGAALYRLASLDYLNNAEREQLHAELAARGGELEKLLLSPEERERGGRVLPDADAAAASRRRMLGLLLEALRRGEVSRDWAREAMELAGMNPEEVGRAFGLVPEVEVRHGVILPEGV